MKASKYEYTMQLLAAMTSEEIAKRKNISKIEAFDIFMQSETAEILFNDEFVLWWNGPVYLAEMYEKEISSKSSIQVLTMNPHIV
jgi:hypothetical protein